MMRMEIALILVLVFVAFIYFSADMSVIFKRYVI